MYNEKGGFCYCGCGNKTNLSDSSRKRLGTIKGEPLRFLHKHNPKLEKHHGWIDGGGTTKNGRKWNHDNNGIWTEEHRLIAEKALGKKLPKGCQVHHINGNSQDNSNSNLVICEDLAYHKLLHRRTRAYRGCGHAGWMKCTICKTYDSKENLYVYESNARHLKCAVEYNKERRRIRSTI